MCVLFTLQVIAQKFLTFTINIDWTSQHTKELKQLYQDTAIQTVVAQCPANQQYVYKLYVTTVMRHIE
jgi:hypothetical protein